MDPSDIEVLPKILPIFTVIAGSVYVNYLNFVLAAQAEFLQAAFRISLKRSLKILQGLTVFEVLSLQRTVPRLTDLLWYQYSKHTQLKSHLKLLKPFKTKLKIKNTISADFACSSSGVCSYGLLLSVYSMYVDEEC